MATFFWNAANCSAHFPAAATTSGSYTVTETTVGFKQNIHEL